MSDLFIIGNGFDRAHGLKTSYYDFHQFLKDNCKNMPYIGAVELVSQDSENKIDGMIVYEPVEYLDFFQIIIDQTDGPDWKNFEEALGRLDFSDILRDFGTINPVPHTRITIITTPANIPVSCVLPPYCSLIVVLDTEPFIGQQPVNAAARFAIPNARSS